MLNENFVYLAAGIIFIGQINYLIGTIRGSIKPNKVSWLLWGLVPFVAFFAEEELRIFYCFKGRTIYLLHGFKKQTQQIPQKEINLAMQRMRNLTSV